LPARPVPICFEGAMTPFHPEENNAEFIEACQRIADMAMVMQLARLQPGTDFLPTKDLQKKFADLTALIDSSNDQIWFVDHKKRLLLANRSSRDNFFSPANKEIRAGMGSAELFSSEVADYFDQVYRMALEGKILKFNHPGRDEREYALVVQAVKSGEEPVGVAVCGHDITEVYHFQEELRRFEQIISSTPDLIALLDRNYKHQIVNDAYLGAFNKPRQELMDISLRDLLGEKAFKRDIELNLEIAFSGEAVHAENWIDLPGLRNRLMAVSYQPLRSQDLTPKYVVINCRDITALKQAEDDRRRIFEASLDMLCSADFDGHLKDLNPAWTHTLGWSMEELKSRPWIEFIVEKDRPATSEANQKLLKGENLVGFENRCTCKDGSIKWLAWSAFPDLQRQRVFSVIRDITKSKQMEEELRHLATTDPLTGASNRRHFLELAALEVKRSRRHATPFAVMQMDIDHFKSINDSYGHDVGDEVLKNLVECCLRELRETDFFGRFGGEEFVALLPQTDQDGALQVCERLRTQICDMVIRTEKGDLSITVSIGLTMLSGDDLTIDSMLKRADTALYRAKNSGRNQVMLY